jgi:hypothetical protein
MTQEVKPQDHPDFVGGWVWTELETRWIEKRITEAVLYEREACAKVAENSFGVIGNTIAIAIRARGEQE